MMKTKRHSTRALVLAVILAVLLTLGGLFVTAWITIGPQGMTLLEGMFLINTRFVGEYEKSDVLDSAMNGMIAGLGDRWSYYLNPARYAATKDQRNNSYEGIGITVSYGREEGLYIEGVVSGGPAEQAGVIPGEIITAVDGISVAGEARGTATELIRGAKGGSVELTLLSEDGATRTVQVERVTVEEDPVEFELLEDGVGYVRVKNFYARSADGLQAAVRELQEQGAKALLFDMRNNGGGYLDQLTAMLDFLLPEGPIFRTKDRSGHERVTESDADFIDLPMAVLVNGGTYSAAEFFAGELQERGAGVIVGTPTSGKGYSQQTYALIGGGAVGISTAEYFTGSGRSFIGTGLHLDREVALTEENDALLAVGKLPHDKDPQFQAALELLKAET